MPRTKSRAPHHGTGISTTIPEPGEDETRYDSGDEQQHQGGEILPDSVTQSIRTGELRPVLPGRDLAPDELHLQRCVGTRLCHTLTDGKWL